MTVTITIDTEDAAFENQAGQEISRILIKLADRLETWEGRNEFKLKLMDFNGNNAGYCKATKI